LLEKQQWRRKEAAAAELDGLRRPAVVSQGRDEEARAKSDEEMQGSAA